MDSALKIALGYHRAKGDASRTRLIGRQRGYHGVNFGGISVGGIAPNRKMFSANLINGVDHLPHTHNLQHAAYSHGQPQWGAHLVEELEHLVALHDASTIAAVIVEPVPGSTGILPPPVGYLERLREICTKHGILLIFDEVITCLWPGWRSLCSPALWCHPRSDYHRQRPDQWSNSHGCGAGYRCYLPGLYAGP